MWRRLQVLLPVAPRNWEFSCKPPHVADLSVFGFFNSCPWNVISLEAILWYLLHIFFSFKDLFVFASNLIISFLAEVGKTSQPVSHSRNWIMRPQSTILLVYWNDTHIPRVLGLQMKGGTWWRDRSRFCIFLAFSLSPLLVDFLALIKSFNLLST